MNLESMVNELVEKTTVGKQIEILQGIMIGLLRNYAVKIKDDLTIYPTDVEVYYYHENNFPDGAVFRHELQRNNFGKLYFHRAGGSLRKDAQFMSLHAGRRIGADICLSNSNDFYFGVLIKKALIKGKEVGLQSQIVGHIIGRDEKAAKNPMTHYEISLLRELEEKSILIQSDDERKNKYVSFGKREGISKNFKDEPLKAHLKLSQ